MAIIEKAWSSGINFFDTADAYGQGKSEEFLGDALRDLGIPRDEIVIATKCFFEMVKPDPLHDGKKAIKNSIKVNNGGLSRKHIFEACEASLKRLKVDYIDLYQIHRLDPDTPIAETMKALHDLVQAGKVRYIGASSMYAWEFAKMQEIAKANGWTQFVSMQNLYNVIYREEEREMIPYCEHEGVGLIPWSPLAGGYLVRKNDPKAQPATEREKLNLQTFGWGDWYDANTDKIRAVLHQIADSRKASYSTVALAWVLHQRPITAPIIGVSKLAQLDDSIAALSFQFSSEELDKLEQPYTPRRISQLPIPSFRSKL